LEGSIPATTQGQTANSSALIDASEINMSDLGSMSVGGKWNQMPQGDMDWTPSEMPRRDEGEISGEWNLEGELPAGRIQRGQGMDGNSILQALPDQQLLLQAMEILQESGGELTDEVKEQLLALGISEEQLSFFEQMQGGFSPGGSPDSRNMPPDRETFPGQTASQNGQTPPEANQQPPVQPEQTRTTTTGAITGSISGYALQLGILGGILAFAIVLVVKFKRGY